MAPGRKKDVRRCFTTQLTQMMFLLLVLLLSERIGHCQAQTAVPETPTSTIATSTVTPASTTAASPPAPTEEPLHCENGGTPNYDGRCCLCSPRFVGCRCDILSGVVAPEKLNRSVSTAIEVKKPFLPQYEDKDSEQFKNFSTEFISEMHPIYNRTVKNFKAVEIIKLSPKSATAASRRSIFSVIIKEEPSSVNAEHDIIVEVPNTAESEKVFHETFAEVKETLEAVGNCSSSTNETEGCPSFAVGSVAAPTEKELDTQAICESELEEGFAQYFSPIREGGILTCVSKCDSSHPDPKVCYNEGTCEVLRQGPTCYCRHTDENWYLSSDCSYLVHKVGLYSGLSVSAALLVLIIAVLTAYIILKQRKQKQKAQQDS